MNQWLNRSHPQTLQAGVILGYFSAVFGLISVGDVRNSLVLLFLLIHMGIGAGAFGTANNRRWAYILLSVCAVLAVIFDLYTLYYLIDLPLLEPTIVTALKGLNGLVFPVALALAVVHVHSREYQKAWFE